MKIIEQIESKMGYSLLKAVDLDDDDSDDIEENNTEFLMITGCVSYIKVKVLSVFEEKEWSIIIIDKESSCRLSKNDWSDHYAHFIQDFNPPLDL